MGWAILIVELGSQDDRFVERQIFEVCHCSDDDRIARAGRLDGFVSSFWANVKIKKRPSTQAGFAIGSPSIPAYYIYASDQLGTSWVITALIAM